MKAEEQLKLWVDGNPMHNEERDECCPDFSCCSGSISPLAIRKKFAKAYRKNDEKVIYEMLTEFLGKCLENENFLNESSE